MPRSSSALQLPALFVLTITFTSTFAQTNRIFQWQFANNVLSTSLPTCVPFSIIVKPFNVKLNNTSGVPPYYMIAFATGGTPSTTLIGTNNRTLSWTVTEPVDSTGSAGGIPPQLFHVIAGQTTQCVIAPSTTPEFTVTSNVTNGLTTCQPWGLSVKGGVPPYNLTLAAVNSPIVTNVTLPFGDDHFTYINRADPGTQLLVLGDGQQEPQYYLPKLYFTGSTDTDCVGLVSSSGNSTIIQEQQEAAASAAGLREQKKKTSIIVGVSVSLGTLLFFGGLTAIVFLRRRDGNKLKPRQFHMEDSIQRDSTNRVPSLVSSMISEKRLPALPISSLPRRTASTSKISLSYPTTQEVLRDISSRPDELGDSRRSHQPSSDRSHRNFAIAGFPAQPRRKAAKFAIGTSVPEYPHEIPLSELGRISDTPSINGPRGSNPLATFIPGSITKACQIGKSLTTTSNILVLTGGHQFLPTFDVCSDATSAMRVL
ncbi:uncharacterized protein LACBIDRAFT_335331 [Laccaria bicolor S238N-H82]|uniref:Predicted protein n=1 Tax=Laccaria bicolor (strain S238N-H82 / ATCC MYA-4686) TaxID=486041 RepID=B0E207_LACBS|nr:uncharacterized protein LACBIDRAFT_335331 [Laccaria bicolor S238N-H82]EDQ99111.1 predicted protein [Laccaria bicolor S238N-H82]|eukprot:XP_001890244.1 predicted protein [Laccaria bicolor S238N-H82]